MSLQKLFFSEPYNLCMVYRGVGLINEMFKSQGEVNKVAYTDNGNEKLWIRKNKPNFRVLSQMYAYNSFISLAFMNCGI